MMLGAQCPILRTLFIVLNLFVLKKPYPINPAVPAAAIARILVLAKSLLLNDPLYLLMSLLSMQNSIIKNKNLLKTVFG